MFYFAHPFGISSPLTTVSSTARTHQQESSNVKTPQNFVRRNVKHPTCRQTTSTASVGRAQSHVASYIPWPENTWRRDENILPTLVQALATQMGEFNLEVISGGANKKSQYASA